MTDLLAKLQVKPGQSVALIGGLPEGADDWLLSDIPGQLDTDLHRDRIRESLVGLDTVRQVAIDDTWSALRLKPARHRPASDGRPP